jgi:protocatechuate 3,4-dioxygenase beta subunit
MDRLPRAFAAVVFLSLLACSGDVPGSQDPIRQAECSGTVVDEQGKPIGGVKVDVMWSDAPGHAMGESATTDAQGRWRVAVPADVRDVDVHITHPDYISDESYRRDKPPMPRLRDGTSVMVMKRGLRISGIVQDEDGKPVADALILPHDRYATTAAGAPIEDSSTTRTGADGGFVLSGLPAGPRELTVTARGFGPESVGVDVTPETPTIRVTLRPGGIFLGQVLDEDGQPIEDARVSCCRWRTPQGHIVNLTGRTDVEGRFRIADAPSKGSLEFFVSKRGYLLRNDRVSLPAEPYRIVLYRPPVLSGRVLDNDTGEPVTDFELTQGILWGTGGRPSWRTPQAVQSKDGAFTATVDHFVVGAALASCMVRVHAAGYVPEASPAVMLGEKSGPFVVRLHRGRTWTGFIRDAADRPVSNASVSWLGPDRIAFIKNGQLQRQFTASPEWVVRTDPNGRFELPPARTEGIILALHETGYGWWHSDGFGRDSAVRLTAWSRIDGTVRVAGSDNHVVQLKMEPADPDADPNHQPIRWFFDETSHVDGRFTFDCVPAIPLAVGHLSQGRFFLAEHVEPEPGRTHAIRIEIPAAPTAPCSLVGGALPKMERIGIESAAALQNRRVLLCFFDVQQRPSRHCMDSLARQVDTLRRKGVALVAVQAAPVQENTWQAWMAERSRAFPLGRIDGDPEEVKSAWGIRSLPWLVLTDDRHTVVAEGFAIAELENRLVQMGENR